MSDLADEAPIAIKHEYGIGHGRGFDAEPQPFEIGEADHRLGDPGTEHNREGRILVGAGWRQRAELDAPAPIRGLGTFEVRHACRRHPRLAEGAARQGIAADELAATIGKQRIGIQGAASVGIELGLEPLDLERALEALSDRLRERDEEAAALVLVANRVERDVLVEANGECLRCGGRRRKRAGRHQFKREEPQTPRSGHDLLLLRTNAQISPISSWVRTSPQGGMRLLLPLVTDSKKRSCWPRGNSRRSNVTFPADTMLRP